MVRQALCRLRRLLRADRRGSGLSGAGGSRPGAPRMFYRFSKPSDPHFPTMLEFFARYNPDVESAPHCILWA